MRSVFLMIVACCVTLCAVACGKGAPPEETDTFEDKPTGEAAAEDDAGTDTGTALADETACLSSISGAVLQNGETGMEAVIAVCIGLRCLTPVVSSPDGDFVWAYPIEEGTTCGRHDFRAEPLHIEITAAKSPEDYAGYAFVTHPAQEDLSDNGESGFDLDLGPLFLFRLPEASATYVPDQGATVEGEGLSFSLGARGIVKRVIREDVPIEHVQEIRIFKAPLDTWSPPFAEVDLDALFFISPRWAKLSGEGVALALDPPPDWEGGQEGALYLLGSYISDYGDTAVRDRAAFIYRTSDGRCINTEETEAHDAVADGRLERCGAVTFDNGRLETDPIPRFTWIGVARE